MHLLTVRRAMLYFYRLAMESRSGLWHRYQPPPPLLSRDDRESLLDRKIEQVKQRNQELMKKHAVVIFVIPF